MYQETRRRQQVEAAEKRRMEAESRGVKDPEKIKRQQKRVEDLEKREQVVTKDGGPSLRVNFFSTNRFYQLECFPEINGSKLNFGIKSEVIK